MYVLEDEYNLIEYFNTNLEAKKYYLYLKLFGIQNIKNDCPEDFIKKHHIEELTNAKEAIPAIMVLIKNEQFDDAITLINLKARFLDNYSKYSLSIYEIELSKINVDKELNLIIRQSELESFK